MIFSLFKRRLPEVCKFCGCKMIYKTIIDADSAKYNRKTGLVERKSFNLLICYQLRYRNNLDVSYIKWTKRSYGGQISAQHEARFLNKYETLYTQPECN